MPKARTYRYSFLLLLLVLLLVFGLNISSGSVNIPLRDTLNSIFGGTVQNESWNYIIWDYRLPKALTAILVGSGLALSGLLMQTLFRKSFGRAVRFRDQLGSKSRCSALNYGFVNIGRHFFLQICQRYFLGHGSERWKLFSIACRDVCCTRVKDTMALLIIGLMFGSVYCGNRQYFILFHKRRKITAVYLLVIW